MTGTYQEHVAAQMSEAALQNRILLLASAFGWMAYHTHDSRRSQKGFPDLVLLHPGQGRLLFRELKSAKGRTTPEQTLWLEGLVAAGFDAGVWRPADLLDRTVENALRGGGEP